MSAARSVPMSDASIRSRKSRLGCKTCKIRKVKCGEEKPQCLRCTSTGRKCEYEGTVSSSIHNALSPTPNTTWRERRAFAYYFDQAASFVGGGLDIEFWRTVVPQVCRSEPAVWDAINSVSALFESSEPCPNFTSLRQIGPPPLNQKQRDALEWYSRSVSAVRRRIERGAVDIFVGLVSCVLFICIESLQGSVDAALQLYNQGLCLILSLRAQIAGGVMPAINAYLLEGTIVPIFIRLGAIAFTISGVPVEALLPDTEYAPEREFTTLKAARESIFVLASEIQLFQRDCVEHLQQSGASHVSQDLVDQQAILSHRLKTWQVAFSRLTEMLRTRHDAPHYIGTSALLFNYHEMLFVILGTCVSRLETVTDTYLPNFQNIVTQSGIALDAFTRPDGTQPPFTFEMNVGYPLWFTTLRCREPRIRRTALALLRRSPQVQGVYKCQPAAALGEQIMIMEETRGMAMNASHAFGNTGIVESTDTPTARGSHAEGIGRERHRSDRNDLLSNSSPMSADMTSTPPAELIPEEARIGPLKAFRPRDGLPPGTTEEDVAEWKQNPDQNILRLSWNERDLPTDSWRVAHEYIPIEM